MFEFDLKIVRWIQFLLAQLSLHKTHFIFFDRCPAHPNPLDRFIANYSLADLHHHYKKYIQKRPKHILF